MNNLADLQSLFQDYVVSAETSAVPAFVGNATASADTRLNVYYEAYRLRLLEILRTDFPGLAALMNADSFNAMGLRYLEQFPSAHPSVRVFGRHLAEFLSVDGAFADWPWLAEMARFEWQRGLAFDGPDAQRLTLETLGALPAQDWPALRISFNPTLQRARYDWNIGSIWRAVNAKEPVPVPARLEQTVDIAIWRKDITLYWRTLDAHEVHAIEAFAGGADFAAVCDVLCVYKEPAAIPAWIAGRLNQWVTEGLITQ